MTKKNRGEKQEHENKGRMSQGDQGMNWEIGV